MNINHQLFGLFGDTYYMVPDCSHVVIPENIDYSSRMIQTQISERLPQAEIDMYHYYTDLVDNCNAIRVSNMKQMIIGENLTWIDSINNSYVIGIRYELYNNTGKLIKSGTSECEAKYCAAQINDEIKEGNILEYRKAMVYDGRIEIPVPEIQRYGIKNAYNQHPYTLKVKDIYIAASKGEYSIITERGSQMDDCITHHNHRAYSSRYACHMSDPLCERSFGSCFLTNAKVGTTMIDATVLPMKLDIPEKVERVDICHIPCDGPEYTMTLNRKLSIIIMNLEVLLDNFNYVYNINDITELLQHNMGETDEPNYDPDDMSPIYPDGCLGHHKCKNKCKHRPAKPEGPDEPEEEEDPEEDEPDTPEEPEDEEPEDGDSNEGDEQGPSEEDGAGDDGEDDFDEEEEEEESEEPEDEEEDDDEDDDNTGKDETDGPQTELEA